MSSLYLIFGLVATFATTRVMWRRIQRFRHRRDSRARRELVTALAFLIVAIGLLATTLVGWAGWPLNLRIVVGAMTVGAFVAAMIVFDQEDAGDGPA